MIYNGDNMTDADLESLVLITQRRFLDSVWRATDSANSGDENEYERQMIIARVIYLELDRQRQALLKSRQDTRENSERVKLWAEHETRE